MQPVMIDYSRIDPEIQDDFELRGIEQAISGQEWLRRSEERTMEEIGEGSAPVIVYEPEEPEIRLLGVESTWKAALMVARLLLVEGLA